MAEIGAFEVGNFALLCCPAKREPHVGLALLLVRPRPPVGRPLAPRLVAVAGRVAAARVAGAPVAAVEAPAPGALVVAAGPPPPAGARAPARRPRAGPPAAARRRPPVVAARRPAPGPLPRHPLRRPLGPLAPRVEPEPAPRVRDRRAVELLEGARRLGLALEGHEGVERRAVRARVVGPVGRHGPEALEEVGDEGLVPLEGQVAHPQRLLRVLARPLAVGGGLRHGVLRIYKARKLLRMRDGEPRRSQNCGKGAAQPGDVGAASAAARRGPAPFEAPRNAPSTATTRRTRHAH